MKVEGSYRFDAERESVWDALLDPSILAACIPGCQKLEPTGEDAYDIAISVGVGAIRGAYQGTVTVADKSHPDSYRMLVEGRGGGGTVRGDALLTFSSSQGGTEVTLVGDALVTGVVARVGQRLMGNASRMLMNQFFDCMKSHIDAR